MKQSGCLLSKDKTLQKNDINPKRKEALMPVYSVEITFSNENIQDANETRDWFIDELKGTDYVVGGVSEHVSLEEILEISHRAAGIDLDAA